MSNNVNVLVDVRCGAIRARIDEISSVRYVKADDNLTDEERCIAWRVQDRANSIRKKRIDGQSGVPAHWIVGCDLSWIYAWAMCPHCDPFTDLLEAEASYGPCNRPRLPGVSVEDVKRRGEYLRKALEARLDQIRGQNEKRERNG